MLRGGEQQGLHGDCRVALPMLCHGLVGKSVKSAFLFKLKDYFFLLEVSDATSQVKSLGMPISLG